jgi:phosphatidylinositol-3-phosphatase
VVATMLALLYLGVFGGLAPAPPRSVADFIPHAHAAPRASTVTLIVMENRDDQGIVGNAAAPYINASLVPASALMTNSHAVAHPSQPNYLALFSGSTQEITGDSCPHTFSAANLGSAVIAAGKSFAGYSESMPSAGFTRCISSNRLYARKHNPWVNFSNVPATSNLVYDAFPKHPRSVQFIIPNMCHDMHDCSTRTGDAWLKTHLPAILKWDDANDGLLILTWDEAEPDRGGNPIATLLAGPMIIPGRYSQHITHYDVLRTIEDIFGLSCTANACSANDLTGMWK